jgi:spermidine synthase
MGGMDAMVSGHLTERLYATCRGASNCPWAATLSGALIGILAVSTGLSWALTWSDDRAFTNAAILMVAGGVVAGRRFSLSRYLNPSELAVIACTWTLLQPWIISGLAMLMPFVPMSLLASESTRLMVGLGMAVPVWFVTSWLTTGFLFGVLDSNTGRWDRSGLAAGMAFGFAVGVGISALLLAPWIGAWCTVACAVGVLVLSRLLGAAQWLGLATDQNASQSPVDSHSETGGVKLGAGLMQTVAMVAIGGLIAVLMRLTGQLMPNTWQVYSAEWMGLALGFGIGQLLHRQRTGATGHAPWQMLVPAACGALLLTTFPTVVGLALWATASLTSITSLTTFRVFLLMLLMAPAGYGMSAIAPRVRGSFGRVLPVVGMAIGFVLTQFCFEGASLSFVLAVICSSLVLTSLVTLATSGPMSLAWPMRAGIAFCCVFSLSVPLWSGHHNPALVAKLLFSTPSFVAHRIGWESRLLPMLDDAHAIYGSEGIHGPLTVWRSHGLELHVRENGIPRAVISANTEAYPQFAPEVLQAVYPLVLVEQPNRVLLLGASGGIPLATCLQFPTHEIVCVEDDRHLTDVIAGPLATETGLNPLVDERVQLVTIPPTLAVMSSHERFDVILSSPPSSSIVAGGAMFTADHYQHASRCLADGGIFCQRFQCVDYGPDPLRIVVQSMRRAFHEVIAIETAAGEFLLLGANTPEAFAPEDLAMRLQAQHVRQLLARSGLDWSALLNFPAYDHHALAEICSEARSWTNAPANGILALRAPLELIRWAPKLQETQQVLTAVRTSPAPFATPDESATEDEEEVQRSRKSRMLEWLGDRRVSPDLLRRLSEVATQYKLVQENPESHWWEYRKALKEQMQNRRQSVVQQVGHNDEKAAKHPEDEWRKAYFTALGVAAHKPTAELIAEVAKHLQPYDPLVSYFARQEIADLQFRGQTDAVSELEHRLHVIYFAPTVDGSTRNVVTAIELLIKHPEAIPDPGRRYDTLNGLLQTLRNRWESRQSYPVKSARRQLSDVDRSLVAADKGVQTLEDWHHEAHVSDSDWAIRKQVVERILQRPLHDYRTQLQTTATRNETRNRLKNANADATEAK